MIKEVIDDVDSYVNGTVVYSNLYTDEEELTWNILVRVGGSISLFATSPRFGGHGVVYDTLDGLPPNETAIKVIGHLKDMAEGINLLTAALNEQSETELAQKDC